MADDDPDREHLGRDAKGRAGGDLGGPDGGDPSAVEFGHITEPHGRSFWRALDAGLSLTQAPLSANVVCGREPETGADQWTEARTEEVI